MNVNQILPEVEDYRQVRVAIGGDGENYSSQSPHFDVTAVTYSNQSPLTLVLPDTVAEYFRQQGRRELQAEMRKLINAERG